MTPFGLMVKPVKDKKKEAEGNRDDPPKKPRLGIFKKAPEGRSVCKPADGITLTSLLSKFKSKKLKPYTFKAEEVMSIGKYKDKTACPDYMLGASCESQDCDYHLNLATLESIKGRSTCASHTLNSDLGSQRTRNTSSSPRKHSHTHTTNRLKKANEPLQDGQVELTSK